MNTEDLGQLEKMLADFETDLDEAETEADEAFSKSEDLANTVGSLKEQLAEIRGLVEHIISEEEGKVASK